MRLLVTRPLPDAERTVQALRQRGHDVLLAPVLRTETIAAPIEDGCDYGAIVMTSANAARAASRHPRLAELRKLSVVTVGQRTAEAAKDAGFTLAGTAGGSLSDLAAFLPTIFGAGTRLLYLAGEDRAGDLAVAVRPHGLTVDTVVIYRAVAANALPAEAAQALASGSLDGVLHYSARSATIVLSLCEQAGVLVPLLDLSHVCLSEQVAIPLRRAGATRISVAPYPDEAALISLTES